MKSPFFFTPISFAKNRISQVILLALFLASGVSLAAFTEPANPAIGGNPPNPLTTSASKQVKTGSLWARGISTAAPTGGKLCLDLGGTKNDDHCVTSWTMTPYGNPKCRLESAQVSARPASVGFSPSYGPYFSTDLWANNCDAMLSTQSKNDGWIYTGHDNLTRVQSNDAQSPQVCWFMRLVCDKNVTVLTGHTSDPPISYNASVGIPNLTISPNQCSDNINNDPPSWYFVSNPSVAPSAYGRNMAVSDDMTYLMVTDDSSPVSHIYKRAGAGSDTYTRLNTGAQGQGFNVEPNTRDGAFTANGQFLVTASWEAGSYLKVYENISDTFTKLVSPNGPSVNPPNWVNDVSIFEEGSNIYVAATHYDGNRISIYKKTGTASRVFTYLPSALDSYPSSASAEGVGVDFSTDGNYLAVTTSYVAGQPIVTIYKRTGPSADTWNKLTSPNGPNFQPSNQGEGVAFSNDGTYLAVAHHGTNPNFFTIYKKNGDAFERLTAPNGLDTDPVSYPVNSLQYSWLGVANPSFSSDGNYLALPDYSAASGSSLKVYKRTGDSFKKMANSTYNMANVYSVQFSSDNQRLFTTFAYLNGVAQKYVALLKLEGDDFTDHPADPQCSAWDDNNESS